MTTLSTNLSGLLTWLLYCLKDGLMEVLREVQINSFAFVFAGMRVAAKIPKWIRGGVPAAVRENPPECLFDPLLGRHLYVKINGTKFHYVENGSRLQELVLCLHDFSDFWYGWRNQLKALSNTHWVVAMDLKGFGDSDKPFLASKYRDDVVVEELKTFIEVLQENDRKIVIMGHGLGGHLAWRFVEKYPEMVSRFVSISTPHPRIWLRHVMRSWRSVLENRWLYVCRLPFLPEMEMVSNDLEVFDKRFATRSNSVTDLRNYSPLDKEAYKYSFSRTTDWQGPINYFRNLPLADSSVLAGGPPKQCIPVETLLVVGNMDPEVSLELVSQSAEYVDRFAMQIINGAGHNPHQEQPEIVNRHIAKFIKGPEPVEEEKVLSDPSVREVVDQLPLARQQLLQSYSQPVTRAFTSSTEFVTGLGSSVSNGLGSVSSGLSSVTSLGSNLPVIGGYLPKLSPLG